MIPKADHIGEQIWKHCSLQVVECVSNHVSWDIVQQIENQLAGVETSIEIKNYILSCCRDKQ